MSSNAQTSTKERSKTWLNEQNVHAHNGPKYLRLSGTLDALLAIGQAYFIALVAHQLLIVKSVTPWAALGLIAALLLRTVNTAWRANTAAKTETSIVRATREQLVDSLLAGKAANQTTGEASTALLEQTVAIGKYHSNYAPQQKVVSYAMVLFLIVAFYTDWIVGAIFLITAPLIPLFMALVGSRAQVAADEHMQNMRYLGGYFLDRLKGALTLRAFAREQQETDAVYQASGEFRESTMSVLRIAFLTSTVLELFSALAIALVAVYVGLHLLDLVSFGPGPKLDFRTGLFVLLLAPEFYTPMRQLAAGHHDRSNGIAAAEALAPLLEPSNDTSNANTLMQAPAVRLQGLSYAYRENEPILQQLNANINAGECLVIRGDSGTGKSTLLKIMANLLTPTDGSIEYNVDGNTIHQIAPGSYAWVSQTPWFTHDTVANNLRQVAPNANDQQLTSVLEQCGLGYISLEQQLDEQGAGLSGGEGRRLGIARALLSEAPIWFLDEPTAELDEQTEQDIIALLDQLKGKHTLIIATHSEACAALNDSTLWVHPPQTVVVEANNEHA